MTFYLPADDGYLIPSIQKPIIRYSEKLPAGTYRVKSILTPAGRTSVLAPADDLVVRGKQYGSALNKIDRVLKAYGKMDRSLGVILSGPKGIGKSMFARQLSIEARKRLGMATIVVDSTVPDIAEVLESIDDECVVLFDEFDKTYYSGRLDEEDHDEYGSQQTRLLSLFDGTSSKKKLFIVTCNKLSGLSDLILNRPGRFHYHLRFKYPDVDQVTQYMLDNLDEEAQKQIPEVVRFSELVELNYDQLRAIAFELNLGGRFADVIDDLNILDMGTSYRGKLTGVDGRDVMFIDVDYHDLTKDGLLELTHLNVLSSGDDGHTHMCNVGVSFRPADLKRAEDGSLYTDEVELTDQCRTCLRKLKNHEISEEDLFKPARISFSRSTDYRSYSYNDDSDSSSSTRNQTYIPDPDSEDEW